MNESVISTISERLEKEPFARKMGIHLVALAPGRATVEMQPRRDLINMFGMIHGGAIFSLIDEAFQVAGNSHGTVAVALNMNVSYLATPEIGSRLTAEAREFHRTRRTAHYEIKVTDDREKLIATCQALTYIKGDRLPFL